MVEEERVREREERPSRWDAQATTNKVAESANAATPWHRGWAGLGRGDGRAADKRGRLFSRLASRWGRH